LRLGCRLGQRRATTDRARASSGSRGSRRQNQPLLRTLTGVDPVSTGLVASLARPGGNVTGLAVDAGGEILGKRFELLKEMLPDLSRLGIMWNPDVAVNRSRQAAMTETARTLGLTTIPVEVRG